MILMGHLTSADHARLGGSQPCCYPSVLLFPAVTAPRCSSSSVLLPLTDADLCASQVGGYTFMHRDDLSKVAPLWLSVTEDVREDPEVRSELKVSERTLR